MPKRCLRCPGGADLVERRTTVSRAVAGHKFVAELAGRGCVRCGREYPDDTSIARLDLHVALRLSEAGVSSGEAFRFMRKALGLRGTDLAELLDVAPETVSRWETDKRAVHRGAYALVASLVRDRIEGRSGTLDALHALKRPTPLGETVVLEDLERAS
jgi:DNA-binding transcriptional regulator YiaG